MNTAQNLAFSSGAMMVSRWFQPGLAVSHDIVCKQLDDIADRVRKQLRQMLSDVHPACEKSYLEAGKDCPFYLCIDNTSAMNKQKFICIVPLCPI